MAVFLCVLGIALKPHMVIPFLLVVGVYPKQCLKSAAIGIVILFLFPFLCQTPSYAIEQYKIILSVLASAQEHGHEVPWADFFGMLKLLGLT